MNRDTFILEIQSLINECKNSVLPTQWYPEGVLGAPYYVEKDVYDGWYTKAMTLLRGVLPDNNVYLEKFCSFEKNIYANAASCKTVLESLIESIEKGYLCFKDETKQDVDSMLDTVFTRFYRVARQLRSRHENRPTLDVNDEYDVQDLLHALLKLYFDDIRPEEWTPSYAGKSARMDFLLKNEQIVIEVKKTRRGLTDKELGDQLIIDVERYKVHPDCRHLICFVYDPEGLIGNPSGLCKDLNDSHKGFVEVIVQPSL